MTGINYLHTLAALALLQTFSPRYFLHYNVYLHKIYVSPRSRRFINSQLEKSKREHEKLVDLIFLPFTIPITRSSAASKPCKVAVTERLSTSSCMSHELPRHYSKESCNRGNGALEYRMASSCMRPAEWGNVWGSRRTVAPNEYFSSFAKPSALMSYGLHHSFERG